MGHTFFNRHSKFQNNSKPNNQILTSTWISLIFLFYIWFWFVSFTNLCISEFKYHNQYYIFLCINTILCCCRQIFAVSSNHINTTESKVLSNTHSFHHFELKKNRIFFYILGYCVYYILYVTQELWKFIHLKIPDT